MWARYLYMRIKMGKLLLLIYETLLLVLNWVDVITGNVVFKEMF